MARRHQFEGLRRAAGFGVDGHNGFSAVTLTVNLSTDTNFVMFERFIAGVDPDDLELLHEVLTKISEDHRRFNYERTSEIT